MEKFWNTEPMDFSPDRFHPNMLWAPTHTMWDAANYGGRSYQASSHDESFPLKTYSSSSDFSVTSSHFASRFVPSFNHNHWDFHLSSFCERSDIRCGVHDGKTCSQPAKDTVQNRPPWPGRQQLWSPPPPVLEEDGNCHWEVMPVLPELEEGVVLEEAVDTELSPLPKSTRRQKRKRTVFTATQLLDLEEHFRMGHYLDKARREHLAADLKLPEKQVKIWFQNRRMKVKRVPARHRYPT